MPKQDQRGFQLAFPLCFAFTQIVECLRVFQASPRSAAALLCAPERSRWPSWSEKIVLFLALVFGLLLLPSEGSAFRFLSKSKQGASPRLRALQLFLHRDGSTTEFQLQAVLQPPPKEAVAWLLTAPKEATFREGTAVVMDQVSEFSTPFVELHASRTNQTPGCGSPPPPAPQTDDSRSILRLLMAKEVTGYRIVLLDKPTASAIRSDLEALGYPTEAADEAAIQAKLDAAQRLFLLEIPAFQGPGEIFKIAPLVIRYPQPQKETLAFTHFQDQASTPLPLLLFTLTTDRIAIPSYKGSDIDAIALEIRRQFFADNTLIYENAIDSLDPQGQTLFTEFARDLRKICPTTIRAEDPAKSFCDKYATSFGRIRSDDSFLTRLHGRLSPASLQDASLQVAPRTEVSGQVIVERSLPSTIAFAFFGPLPLLALLLALFFYGRLGARTSRRWRVAQSRRERR